MLSARFEGFDERILAHLCSDAISIGPYVLSGGELPAMVDGRRDRQAAAGRARRGVGPSTRRSRPSSRAGSSSRTTRARPSSAAGACPTSSLSGDHGRIEDWRREQSRARSVSLTDLYALLGVAPSASEDEIRSAYYRRLRFDAVETPTRGTGGCVSCARPTRCSPTPKSAHLRRRSRRVGAGVRRGR